MPDSPTNPLREDYPCASGVSPLDEAAESWVARIEKGLTVAEEVEFADWLAADARHEARFREYQAAWTRFAPLAAAVARDPVPDPNRFVSADGASHRFSRSARPRAHRRARPVVSGWVVSFGFAAAIALLLAVYSPWRHPAAGTPFSLPAPIKQRTLADGSVVQLNRGAEVTLDFNDAERRVRLERGEATFTVASNPARPFIVTAGAIEVRALGTAFNVRIEPVAVEVVVTEGTVQLADRPADHRGTNSSAVNAGAVIPAASSATVVTAGQRAFVASTASASSPQVTSLTPGEMEARLAWQPRMLNFDDAPLSAIVAEFNRRNPVHLVVRDSVVANRRMTATFRSDNLEAFVRLLESNIGVRAERLSDKEIALVRR